MTCASCQNFVAKAFALATVSPDEKWASAPAGHGICRRYPPKHVADLEANETMSLFPSVHRDQSCGEYFSGMPIC